MTSPNGNASGIATLCDNAYSLAKIKASILVKRDLCLCLSNSSL